MPRNTSKASRGKIKRRANNEFSALSGIRAFQLSGSCDCLVTEQTTANGYPIKKYAYLLYNNLLVGAHPKRIKSIRVKSSCGVDQCVNPAHFIVTDPLKDTPPGAIF